MRPSFLNSPSIYLMEKELFISELLFEKNKKVLLILSKTMEKRANLLRLTEGLERNNEVIRITDILPNPTDAQLYQCLKQLKFVPNKIIGIGGGSTIDLCKGIIAFDYLVGKEFTKAQITEAIEAKDYQNQNHFNISLTVSPTTSGTGSEVTSWGTIWKDDKTAKLSVEDERLTPTCVYLVPEFTNYMPSRLTLTTGLDALNHAVESYWSKRSNSITREMSKTSIQLIVEYLPKVLNYPNDIKYREKMSIASLFAGLAFSNTKTTACHAISYPLTMKYGIDHGFACAITLISLLKRNKYKTVEFDSLIKLWNAEKVEDIETWLEQVCKGVVKLKLTDFGIKKEDIKKIANDVSMTDRIVNNPVTLDEKEIELILWENF